MTQTTRSDTLLKLSDSDLTLANQDADIRGRTVRTGDDEVGKVDDLLIDRDQAQVRFMEVGAGGFLGIGEKKLLIPVDAIMKIDDDNVWIDQSRSRLQGAPAYDPTLVSEDYYDQLYGYYGYQPYWTPGYTYPSYPYYDED
ncbi:MAG TPA: PRC-barrel domain-containing protein [Candidatus Limnocylindria bacterium]|jgi:hypothetical protein|nr:PRC-barrel domain-containing protein [Candidatus Limnocylindria bacterium]